jgi:hypothetical protein
VAFLLLSADLPFTRSAAGEFMHQSAPDKSYGCSEHESAILPNQYAHSLGVLLLELTQLIGRLLNPAGWGCRERSLSEAMFVSYALLSNTPGASAVDEVH